MKCHKCNQDSLYIEKNYLQCDICGLSLLNDKDIYDLLLYNFNMDQIYKEGRDAYMSGKDCPYDSLILKIAWDNGWKFEKKETEKEGLISSAKNIMSELEELSKEKEALEVLNSKNKDWSLAVSNVLHKIEKQSYFFGFSYRRHIKEMSKELKKIGDEILNS